MPERGPRGGTVSCFIHGEGSTGNQGCAERVFRFVNSKDMGSGNPPSPAENDVAMRRNTWKGVHLRGRDRGNEKMRGGEVKCHVDEKGNANRNSKGFQINIHMFLQVYRWAEHQATISSDIIENPSLNLNEKIKEKFTKVFHNLDFEKMSSAFLIKFVGKCSVIWAEPRQTPYIRSRSRGNTGFNIGYSNFSSQSNASLGWSA